MLADPLLTEHYAKAGLGAVLIDQQHGLSREFVIWQLMFYMICGHGSQMSCSWVSHKYVQMVTNCL